tara:strand:- start:104 stop:382 length:279 start_codon:yes stop_codon:yes gene_type:complete
MSPEQAVEKLRSEKNDPTSTGGFFYKMLLEASPEVIEAMEKQAASLVAAGHNIGRAFDTANKDPELRSKFITELKKMSIKMGKNTEEDAEDE